MLYLLSPIYQMFKPCFSLTRSPYFSFWGVVFLVSCVFLSQARSTQLYVDPQEEEPDVAGGNWNKACRWGQKASETELTDQDSSHSVSPRYASNVALRPDMLPAATQVGQVFQTPLNGTSFSGCVKSSIRSGLRSQARQHKRRGAGLARGSGSTCFQRCQLT